jgi:hypothetical protein
MAHTGWRHVAGGQIGRLEEAARIRDGYSGWGAPDREGVAAAFSGRHVGSAQAT